MAILLRIFIEHEYQYAKAIEFNNIDSSEDILCAKTPVSQNNLDPRSATLRSKNGSSIMEQCERNCYVGSLRIKFAPGSEMAKKLLDTAGKSLAEAGQSTTYSIGMSFYSKYVFKTDKWPKNVLGNLLMKIRQELV